MATNGSLSDPMENLKRTNSFGNSHNQSNSKAMGAGGQPQIPQEYNPSMYDQQSNKRPGAGGGNFYFLPILGKFREHLEIFKPAHHRQWLCSE